MPRVFIITGSSRGIGLGLAENYLAQGDTAIGRSRAAALVRHPSYMHSNSTWPTNKRWWRWSGARFARMGRSTSR